MKNRIVILILFIAFPVCAQQPVNKKATKEARHLLNYIYSLGDKILTGQHSYNENPAEFYDDAQKITGKYPAVWGTDLYWNNRGNPGERVVREAVKMHEKGAIVTLMWHVGRPVDNVPYSWSESVQEPVSENDWQQLFTPGSEVHRRWQAQVDTIAKTLKKLQERHIPVLWRPYHEMNGVWFWWGNRPGEDGFVKLWKMLYRRLTDHHKLNNLIWVWNANGPRDIPYDEAFAYRDFYPGPDYVDILATDVYHYDYEQKDYESLLELAAGKPIALGEVGQLPKPEILEKQPEWSWFMVWSDWLHTANTEERVKSIYDLPQSITREEVTY
ncbi:glycoside hydrolase family 26 protein [Sinomicrobium kalidii]|uniref:glycoside hydrolase family 26 protein n=1 Tax=Sinomicrobium kalidii TaxID=2900738 RepID=UPI001E44EEDD|nr:glycosyl hydrolase [Sinomicrobium kalidii]UGU17886.1 glycoside hydrolase family 26 protein [Sinomicrobium kalidii]